MNAISRQTVDHQQIAVTNAEFHLLHLFRMMSDLQKNTVFSVCDELLSGKSMVVSDSGNWELLDAERNVATDEAARSHIESMCTHLEFLRAWWDKFGKGIEAISPAVAGCIHDHFVEGAISARAVGKEMNFKPITEYAKNYPWLADPHTKRAYYANSF